MNRDEMAFAIATMDIQEKRWQEWKRAYLAGEHRQKEWIGAKELKEARCSF